MKALVLDDVNNINYRDVDTPVPGGDEVRVKVMAAGVCGSDIPRAFVDGAHKMPLIIGHEFAGIVDDKNSELNGKRVGVFPLIPCRNCRPCLSRRYEMCRNYSYLGSRRDGGFAQYVCVPKWNLIELPDGISYEAAAMLEPMAVAVHAMRRVNISPDDVVVVCGLGTIGLLLTMFLVDANVKNLYVIGRKDFQKESVRRLGVSEDRYCDTRTQNAADYISSITDGMGADVFFECVGSNETVSMAVDNVAPGGQVCMVGNPHSDMTFAKNVYWKILRHQLNVTGTWNSSYYGNVNDANPDDWQYVVRCLESGRIHPEKLITHRYLLDEAVNGMNIMRNKSEDYVKIMTYPNGYYEINCDNA